MSCDKEDAQVVDFSDFENVWYQQTTGYTTVYYFADEKCSAGWTQSGDVDNYTEGKWYYDSSTGNDGKIYLSIIINSCTNGYYERDRTCGGEYLVEPLDDGFILHALSDESGQGGFDGWVMRATSLSDKVLVPTYCKE